MNAGFGSLRAETDASNPKQSMWTASLQRQQIELERRRAKFPFDEASHRELSLVYPQSQRLGTPGKSKAIDHSRVSFNSLGVQVATAADGRAPPTAGPRVKAGLSTPRQSLLLARPVVIEAAPKVRSTLMPCTVDRTQGLSCFHYAYPQVVDSRFKYSYIVVSVLLLQLPSKPNRLGDPFRTECIN